MSHDLGVGRGRQLLRRLLDNEPGAREDAEAELAGPAPAKLTDHVVLQAIAKFPRLAGKSYRDVRRLLTAVVRNAVPGPHEHVIIGQYFLVGQCVLGETRVPMTFVVRDEAGVRVVITVLTEDEVLGNGGTRK